jgi:hypothetical protein
MFMKKIMVLFLLFSIGNAFLNAEDKNQGISVAQNAHQRAIQAEISRNAYQKAILECFDQKGTIFGFFITPPICKELDALFDEYKLAQKNSCLASREAIEESENLICQMRLIVSKQEELLKDAEEHHESAQKIKEGILW